MDKINHTGLVALLGLFLLIQSGCGNMKRGQVAPPPNPDYLACQEEIKPFLEQFVAAVNKHSQVEVLQFMDATYLEAQHNQFLEGRTEQFLNEFFSGKSQGGEYFDVRFMEISAFKIERCKQVDADWRIYANLSYKGRKLTCQWTLRNQETGGLGFVGAMG